MKKTRLRIERISARKLPKKGQTHKGPVPPPLSIINEATPARLHGDSENFGTSFLDLYNRQFVEFVRKTGENTYLPVFGPAKATHQLIATSWNIEDDKRHEHAPSDMFALSVVAHPLHVRHLPTSVTVKKAFPKKAPVYNINAALEGKRSVLRFLAVAMNASVKKFVINRMDSDECDQLYHSYIRASRKLQADRVKARTYTGEPSE